MLANPSFDLFPEEDAPDLESYDRIIVAFSGGKDSLATFLHLLDAGVDRNRIELWHHLVDGRGRNFMDWPITEPIGAQDGSEVVTIRRSLPTALSVSAQIVFDADPD